MMPRATVGGCLRQAPGGSFARTGHAMRAMEAVAAAAAQREPVLLVGETGSGKTTLVQQIARQVRARAAAAGVHAPAAGLVSRASALATGVMPVPRHSMLGNVALRGSGRLQGQTNCHEQRTVDITGPMWGLL